jgi:hypothetical protein
VSIGFDSMRAWSDRRFVGGELIDLGNTFHVFLAGYVGCDVEQAGLGLGTGKVLRIGHDFGSAKRSMLKLRWVKVMMAAYPAIASKSRKTL